MSPVLSTFEIPTAAVLSVAVVPVVASHAARHWQITSSNPWVVARSVEWSALPWCSLLLFGFAGQFLTRNLGLEPMNSSSFKVNSLPPAPVWACGSLASPAVPVSPVKTHVTWAEALRSFWWWFSRFAKFSYLMHMFQILICREETHIVY